MKPVITGLKTTVKLFTLWAMPPGVVRLSLPFTAKGGTVTVTLVALCTVNALAATPLKLTAVVPVRLVPVMVTCEPIGPAVGEKPVMVGPGWVTVNAVLLVAVLVAEPTVITPVPAPLGTVATILASLAMVKAAFVPLNFTPVAALSPLPAMLTCVPTGPETGEKPLMLTAALVLSTVRAMGLVSARTPSKTRTLKE